MQIYLKNLQSYLKICQLLRAKCSWDLFYLYCDLHVLSCRLFSDLKCFFLLKIFTRNLFSRLFQNLL